MIPIAMLGACAAMLLAIAWPLLVNRLYTADDLGGFAFPLRSFYADGLRAGHINLWCPNLFGGFYLHGEGQIGMLHPFHLLLYRFIPVVQAFGLELTFSYISLFAGAYFLFRRWAVDTFSAAFGAFVFAFGGANLVHIVHVNMIGVVAHAPWLLLATDHCLRDTTPRRRVIWTLVVALLNGSALLLGYPFYYLIALTLQVWYVAYLANVPGWGRLVLRLLVATGFGLLIGGIQLLPTWSALQDSTRARPTFEFLAKGSLHPVNLLQWVNPFFLLGRSFGPLAKHELAIYSGIGPLLLLLWLCTQKADKNRRLAGFLAGLAIMGLFLSLGEYNGLYAWYMRLPLIGIFRVPARYILFTDFALAGASALALNRLRTLPANSSKRWRGFLFCLMLLSVLTVVAKVISATAWKSIAIHISDLPHVLLGSLLVCVGALLFYRVLRIGAAGLTAFWIFCLCDMTFYSGSYLSQLTTGHRSYYEASKPPIPAPGPIALAVSDDRLVLGGYRLAGGYAGLEPSGVLPIKDPTYMRLLGVRAVQDEQNIWTVLDGESFAPLRILRPLYSDRPADALSHADLGATAVVTRRVDIDQPVAGSARILEWNPTSIHIAVETSGRALCMLAQRFHPGWTARIGNHPLNVLSVDGDFTGFVTPGGRQEVILEFAPQDFRLGRDITFFALAIALGIAFIGFVAAKENG
jgi:hypothetical protein